MTIPDFRKCKFSTYGHACGKETIGSDLCDKHAVEKCCSCGQPATHGCDFCGQFVCGAPLCDECVGRTDKGHSGAWGFLNHVHTKKGAPLPSEIKMREDEQEELITYESAALGVSCSQESE